jgi:lipopolysaccharide/colanic/teichoic acid biosynthesis glycosyltransferase
MLVLTAPLLAFTAWLVRADVGRPILFRQIRPGLNGRPFVMVKFRTMRDLRDSSGQLLSNEARLTRIGRFLRSTSLDELPELWNVLRGDMSLVGPRPLLMEYLPLYTPTQFRLTGAIPLRGRIDSGWMCGMSTIERFGSICESSF